MAFKDKIFYKQRPYIYAFLGILTFSFAKKSKLALVCGVILLFCSHLVFRMRKKYQERLALIKAKEKSLADAYGVSKIVIDDK